MKFSTCLRTGCVILSLLAPVRADDARVDAVFNRAIANAQRVRSIEYWSKPELGAQKMRFVADGIRFRAEQFFATAVDGGADRIVAFDGSRYYESYPHDRSFMHSASPNESNPVGQFIPFVELFAWLFEDADLKVWSAIKDPQQWNKRRASARFIEEMKDGDHQVVVIEVTRANPRRKAVVYFAKDLEYLPIRWMSYFDDGTLSATCELVKHRLLQVDGETAVIPTSLAFEQMAHGKQVARKYNIDLEEDTLRVNVPMNDEVFSLAPVASMTIQNLDQPRPDERVSPGATPVITERDRSRFWIVVVLNLLVIFGVIGFWAMRRYRSRGRGGAIPK